MTAEEIQAARNYVTTNGGAYYPLISSNMGVFIRQYFRQVCFDALSKGDVLFIDVVCSPKTKLLFLEWFWKDSFNYLGTIIKIKSDKAMVEKEYSSIIGAFDECKMIIYADNKPIVFVETMN